MSVLAFSRLRYQQPHGPCAINWANPITRGLIGSYYNSVVDWTAPPVNYVDGRNDGTATAVSVETTSSAYAFMAAPKFNGSTSFAKSPTIDLSKFNAVTIAFWLYWNGYANDQTTCITYPTNDPFTTGNTGFTIIPNESTGNFGFAWSNGNGSDFRLGVINRPSAAAWHHIMIILDWSSGPAGIGPAIVDNVLNTPSLSGNFVTAPVIRANGNFIFMQGQGSAKFGAGRLAFVNVWGRRLSFGEIGAYYQNTAQHLAPVSKAYGGQMGGSTAGDSLWFLVQ